ncbi:MAG: HD domain-containing protein [Verrucomicrobiae bacterium]|nr:HD domain-containing protein [Verrucomicrobiae bacterium]
MQEPIPSPLALDADSYAARVHARQRRRHTGEPYIVHPRAVARIIEKYRNDPEIIAAALLHDTVQDQLAGLDCLHRRFTPYVTILVLALTKPSGPEDGSRELRNAMDRLYLAKAPRDAKVIKVAEIMTNLDDLAAHDIAGARQYAREKLEDLLVLTVPGVPMELLSEVKTRIEKILHT